MDADVTELNNILVKDIMRNPGLMVDSNETLAKALSKMKGKVKHEIPVIEDGETVGIIGYGILAKRRHIPLSVTVDSVMYPPPRIGGEDNLTTVSEVLLTNDYISVPVTERNKLIGTVTRRDIIRKLLELGLYTKIPVEDIMNQPVISVKDTDTVQKALREMDNLKERSLPVVDDDGLLRGIFALEKIDVSLRGIRTRASQGERSGEKTHPSIDVRSLMITPPHYVEKESKLEEVMKSIVDNKISTVLVVEEGRPIGIVTSLDIIEMVSSEKERDELLVQISGLDDEDMYEYDTIYTIIGKVLPKISYHVDPRLLNIHIKHHHHSESLTKFTVNLRLGTHRKTFITKKNDWDLISAIMEGMESLEKQVETYKGKKMSLRRH